MGARRGEPVMVPSDLPVAVALDRATGPRRAEVGDLVVLLHEVTGAEPVVWAGRIIGFGEYEYRTASGHRGRAPELAFASGTTHTVHLVEDFAVVWPDLLARLGPHRATRACLHFTRLSRIDAAVLRELLERSLARLAETRSDAGGT